MRPLRLYIDNFECYETAFIDFTQFSAALIVGKKENSDMVSNGVGKTTIFRSIEYVLFNQSDSVLEKIIRDDTTSCKIVMDLLIGAQEYRVIRSRTIKGNTDLTLLQRNNVDGSEEEVYHKIKNGFYIPFCDKKEIEKYWKDLSGSRAGDTEKDLAKLIKINYKSFISTALFLQNDTSGLPNVTPEKRKGILKEAFNLNIYSKLEKIAKEKSSVLIKDLDKNKVLIDNLGNPNKELLTLNVQLKTAQDMFDEKNNALSSLNNSLLCHNDKINELMNIHSGLEAKLADLLSRQKSFSNEKNRLEISVKEYQSKKTNVSKYAKDIIDEIKLLKDSQLKLIDLDFNQIDILIDKNNELKGQISYQEICIKKFIEEYENLKIPMPKDNVCKHCRQTLTDVHKKECLDKISKDMDSFKNDIKKSKELIVKINEEISINQSTINKLNLSKQNLENINSKMASKNKEVSDKKALYEEYSNLLNKFTLELEEKNAEIFLLDEELKKSSLEEDNSVKEKIEQEKNNIAEINKSILFLNKEIAHCNATLAVLNHSIDQKNKDIEKLVKLNKILSDLESKLSVYPSVLQAFSTIPNLIIQNVLDDLQVEANKLLSQLKPGLQLSFFIEKTKGDGDQTETLDINYFVNGKERYYKKLSGGMQLAVSFSLKLGLSFLLQKIIGTDIKFLLLDEIDQSLDKASVDAFSDIIKFFQKDFTILIITHNDRLKDKFAHAILVEQDINNVSRAGVVSSW